MPTTYRVEAHDGNRWSFGIRMNHNSGVPEFCGLWSADQFNTRAEARQMLAMANELTGGSLRIAVVRDFD